MAADVSPRERRWSVRVSGSSLASIVQTVPELPVGAPRVAERGTWHRLGHSLPRNWLGLTGVLILTCVGLAALFGPLVLPFDPLEPSLADRLKPPLTAGTPFGHLLGTDQLGRDLFTRIVYGSRISLAVGVLSVAIAAPCGVMLGLMAGYRGGATDAVLMRVADSQLTIPVEILAISLIAVLGNSLPIVVGVIALVNWVVYARVARAQVLSLRDAEYMHAARALGAGTPRLLLKHLLPNILTPVIIIASYSVALAMILEAGLSFIGVGVPPPTPSWGRILQEGVGYLTSAWWVGLFPGLALALTTLGVNFVGDWLRDSFDPHIQI
jgi:peptide/nickel transport system permease protein